MGLYLVYKIWNEYEFVFSILALSLDSHTTLNKILIESLFLWIIFFINYILVFTITSGKCKLLTLVEFGNYIKWDSIYTVVFFLFYILGDHLITIDTAELLRSKKTLVLFHDGNSAEIAWKEQLILKLMVYVKLMIYTTLLKVKHANLFENEF